MTVPYKSIDEIAAVVQGFESCSTGKDEFTHARHLTVAVWYLHHHTFEQAAGKMRSGLFRFLNHQGVSPEKYNETITLFWLKVVEGFAVRQTGSSLASIRGPQADEQIVSLANELVDSVGKARLVFEYYSEKLINSPAAKGGWLEPDLKQFDF